MFGYQNFDLLRIYIHSFGRKQIRVLARNLLPTEKYKTTVSSSEVADSILSHLREVNLPSNPTIVSLMIVILSNQPDYRPLNKASVMEGFIDILLEKNPLSPGWNLIDPKIKEDFLADLSYHMVRNNCKSLIVNEATNFVIRYFGDAGLDVPLDPSRFLDYFMDRKVLIREDNEISFHFSCFREFFTAKKLLDDRTQDGVFYDEVLDEDNYLKYASEIDYYTGLHRKDREIVKLMSARTKHSQ